MAAACHSWTISRYSPPTYSLTHTYTHPPTKFESPLMKPLWGIKYPGYFQVWRIRVQESECSGNGNNPTGTCCCCRTGVPWICFLFKWIILALLLPAVRKEVFVLLKCHLPVTRRSFIRKAESMTHTRDSIHHVSQSAPVCFSVLSPRDAARELHESSLL